MISIFLNLSTICTWFYFNKILFFVLYKSVNYISILVVRRLKNDDVCLFSKLEYYYLGNAFSQSPIVSS